eukprot:6186843-Pleurochrysis_carterae.AAC.2
MLGPPDPSRMQPDVLRIRETSCEQVHYYNRAIQMEQLQQQDLESDAKQVRARLSACSLRLSAAIRAGVCGCVRVCARVGAKVFVRSFACVSA